MAQNRSSYNEKQLGKIDRIINEVRNQNLYALVFRDGVNGVEAILSSREYDNESLMDALSGKDTGLGDRIIVATSRGPESTEYDIINNISLKKNENSPDGVFATYAGFRNNDPQYHEKLDNIYVVMSERAPENDTKGPGM